MPHARPRHKFPWRESLVGGLVVGSALVSVAWLFYMLRPSGTVAVYGERMPDWRVESSEGRQNVAAEHVFGGGLGILLYHRRVQAVSTIEDELEVPNAHRQ